MASRPRRNGYPAAVLEVLGEEFPHLADLTAAAAVEQALARHVTSPHPAFECIVDDPLIGNWRLRPGRGTTSRVRLACYRTSPTAADRDREERINHALEALPA